VSTNGWDPSLYLRFGSERTRPAIDLAARVDVANPRRVIDLGCGPGNSTAVLRARWPSAAVVGLDNDSEMLAAARQTDVGVSWELGDAATWQPSRSFDVVFSNAMLQWLPDHEELVPRLFRTVAPGGALAAQIPSHSRSVLHRQILETADSPRWREATRLARGAINTRDAEFYYDILSPIATRIDLWETEYCHVLDDSRAVLDWIRGTGLRPFLGALESAEDRSAFESELLARITASFPRRRDGRLLFPFRRLFFVARRGESIPGLTT
jgi:trans-aconitate 2-methyltransferase